MDEFLFLTRSKQKHEMNQRVIVEENKRVGLMCMRWR